MVKNRFTTICGLKEIHHHCFLYEVTSNLGLNRLQFAYVKYQGKESNGKSNEWGNQNTSRFKNLIQEGTLKNPKLVYNYVELASLKIYRGSTGWKMNHVIHSLILYLNLSKCRFDYNW